jgi:hypothetical protein
MDRLLIQLLEEVIKDNSHISNIELERILIIRNIKHFYHFTSLKNLNSIIAHGILGRRTLREKKISYIPSDFGRNDSVEDGICLSVNAPNNYMFDSKVRKGLDLVVLEISNPIKLLKSLRFISVPGNFGRNEIKNYFYNFPEKFTGAIGLNRLFLNDEVREKWNLSNYEPTDARSEIVFFDPIPWEYVSQVISPAGKFYATQEVVREYIKNFNMNIIWTSQNKSKFKRPKWDDHRTEEEYRERTWSPSWD